MAVASPPVDFVDVLPSHLAQQILACLDGHHDLAAASSVSRKWRAVVSEEAVWRGGYARRFPCWGAEATLRGAADWQAREHLSWCERYRWRLGLERRWRAGRRRLAHTLDNHAAWVNALRLVPRGGGVASGGSEGTINLWSLEGEPLLQDTTHGQAVWALDASAASLASGAMDGWVQVLDLASGGVAARMPAGWRGGGRRPPDDADWQQFDVVTSVQLLPCGSQVLAGCMDGTIQLLDLRSPQPTAQQLGWRGGSASGAPASGSSPGLFWRPRGGAAGGSRLCAARCHGHLLVAGGDAPAVTLHDLRMGGARFAELALPAGSHAMPAVFALDLLYPRLATGGDRGQVTVWDLSRLDVPPGVLPPLPCNAAQHGQHAAYKLLPDCPGGASPAAAWAGSPPPQQQAQGAGGGAAVAAASWPSPSDPPRRQRHAAGRGGSSGTDGSAARGSSAAAASLDALAATNDCHLRRGVQMGCVYSLKLLEDWRLLTADHSGRVRLWGCPSPSNGGVDRGCGLQDVGGGGEGAGKAAPGPCLSLGPAFAPSVDDPASALIDLEGGPMRPVGMHALDACLTHLAVAGRDSVVRLYSYEE